MEQLLKIYKIRWFQLIKKFIQFLEKTQKYFSLEYCPRLKPTTEKSVRTDLKCHLLLYHIFAGSKIPANHQT